MGDVLAARSQMAVSLGFHILFAVVGIAMPVLMIIAEVRWRRTGDAMYLELAKRWAKGTAILFAVGAVSGTVLSFELGDRKSTRLNSSHMSISYAVFCLKKKKKKKKKKK